MAVVEIDEYDEPRNMPLEDEGGYPSRWPEKAAKLLAEWICTREEWMDWAACINMGRTPEAIKVFFPDRGGATAEAKAVCDTCPKWVRIKCGLYRDKTESEYGVWDGTTAKRGFKTTG